MTQPALSQQIKALEHELGVRLFDRTKREVTLTKPGVYFLAEANLTLKQAEQARLVVQKVARGELGSLRVAYVPQKQHRRQELDRHCPDGRKSNSGRCRVYRVYIPMQAPVRR
jgi:Bacterial regulatory helix-turn-helix protein, lysR family